jgi:hypothetical protein
VILHPRDYKRLRDLAVLRLELGDRAFEELVGIDIAWVAQPDWFRHALGLVA